MVLGYFVAVDCHCDCDDCYRVIRGRPSWPSDNYRYYRQSRGRRRSRRDNIVNVDDPEALVRHVVRSSGAQDARFLYISYTLIAELSYFEKVKVKKIPSFSNFQTFNFFLILSHALTSDRIKMEKEKKT